MNADVCPDESALQRILQGTPVDAVASELEEHVGRCVECQAILERLATQGDASLNAIEPPELQIVPTLPLVRAVIHAVRVQDKNTPGGGGTVRRPHLERYRVERLLGAGGMGAVFLAVDPRLKRQVAIKTLRAGASSEHDLEERFLREAEAVAAIRSEFVVKVHDLGIDQGTPYLVMEYIAGGSLAEQIRSQGTLAFPQVLQLAREIATALGAAHAAGAIHRDVKPRNVLFDESTGHYKLTDFGLVKFFDRPGQTAASAIAGTPEYMSPEQVDGRPLDARSDLFSLGALLYEACTGESPFRSSSLLASMARVGSHSPRSLSKCNGGIPRWFSDVVDQLLQKDPAARPQSADELLELLQRGDANPPQRPRRTKAVYVVAPLLVLASALVYAKWPADVAETPKPSSTRSAAVAPSASFFIERSGQGYASLRAAIDASRSGDAVTIATRGPHASEPMDLGDKHLTLRAAGGVRPIVVFAAGESSPSPAIDSSGKLTMEGIEIRWSRPNLPGERSRTQLIDTCAVRTRGELELIDCVIRISDRNVCLGMIGSACRLRNTRLNAPRGVGVSWRLQEAAELRLDNCEVVAEYGIAAMVDAAAGASYEGNLAIMRSTLRGGRLLDLRGAIGPKHQIQSTLEQCRVDVQHVVVLDWSLAGPRALERPSLQESADQIRRVLRWREKRNAYAAKLRFLAHDSPRLLIAEIAGAPTDLPAWEAFWRIGATESVQGETPGINSSQFGADLSTDPSASTSDAVQDASTTEGEDLLQ